MRIFSGIQPTGQLHIGNFLGATKHWLELQENHKCLFMVADLHALTNLQKPDEFSKATMEKVIELLSIGLDPEKCIIFMQSHVKQHTELAWIFNTITPISELERMTQYKDKAAKNKKNINAGLLTYPTLMAADILLYRTDGVPVGKDQTQHLELTRIIARKFNAQFGNTFKEPKDLIPKDGAKIMSLEDPKRKMSKSDGPMTYISLFEKPESIRKKIMRAKTDTGTEVLYNPVKKPGVSNLLTIYSLFGGQTIQETQKQFKGKGYSVLKKSLAELLVERLDPFRKKQKELQNRKVYIKEILKSGSNKARSIAEDTMEDVRSKIGLLS